MRKYIITYETPDKVLENIVFWGTNISIDDEWVIVFREVKDRTGEQIVIAIPKDSIWTVREELT